ncbi:FGGY-family carbohydrate kinase [Geodermatophilus sp. SYSU D00815]
MSDQSLVLGVDLATADVRVLAVDAGTGAVVGRAAAPLPAPSVPGPGQQEQPPVHAAVARAVLRAVTTALGRRAADVGALAVTATSGSVVPAGADGAPAGPVLLYADRRGAGLLPAPGAPTLHRLAWLAAERPGARYLHVPDLVVADLTGRLVTDTSHALKAGIDPVAARWPLDLLAAAGIPAGALPELVRPGTDVGEVRAAAAADVGLPAGVRVVAGMTDGCTAQLATGAVVPGRTTGVLGTTLVLKGVADHEVTGFGGAVYSHLAPDGAWWPGGASNTGAGVLGADVDLAAADAAAARLGPSPWTAYPLPGTGERFPFARPDATGFLTGPGTPAPAERHRALLDAVALVERLGLERLAALGVASTDHRVAGGGTRSAVWTTIRASALARPVTVPAQPSSAFGAAVLAAAARAGEPVAAAADRLVVPAAVVDPDPRQTGPLDEGYRRLTGELRRRGWLG